MSVSGSRSDPLALIADQFICQVRQGGQPDVSAWAAAHPEFASRIRAEFPVLLAREIDNRTAAFPEFTGNVVVDPVVPVAGPGPMANGACPLRLGDFRIRREIGRGGMGVVYEALQESLGRHVALKVLPPHQSRGPHLERFIREAKAAARLHHSNIVPVFGVGETDGTHYYAMQFIHGQGLDVVLGEVRRRRNVATDALGAEPTVALANGRGPDPAPAPAAAEPSTPVPDVLDGHFDLGPDVTMVAPSVPGRQAADQELATATGAEYYRCVARIGQQAAEALAYAHHQGVIHRDVKPSNLLLDIHGVAWIADFGLAKADDAGDLTGDRDILGTLRYMAPERFTGGADARSDLYALGMTLYELVALRPAFDEADRPRLVERVTKGTPPPLRSLDPVVPRDLETVILKAIRREPEGRYPTGAALAEDLHRFLADRPVLARRASPWELGYRWCKRNPLVGGLAAAVAVLLLALLGLSSAAAVQLRGERDQARKSLERAEKAEQSARERLWVSYMAQARAGRFGRQLGQRFDTLDAVADATKIRPGPELRVQAIACLALPDLKPAARFLGWPAESRVAAFSGALDLFARTDLDGGLTLLRPRDAKELLRVPGDGNPARPLVSDDGRAVALWHELNGRLEIWAVTAGKATRWKTVETGVGRAHAFSPDGTALFAALADGSLVRYDLRVKDAAPARLPAPDAPPQALEPHPTEPRLAVACGPLLQLLDWRTGEATKVWTAAGRIGAVAWHPDGRAVAATTDDGRVHLIDTAAQRRLHVLEGHRGEGVQAAFNRGGDLLVTAGPEGTLRLWNPRTGKQLLRTPGQFAGLRFSADDAQLAAEAKDGAVQLWAVQPGREYRTLVSHTAAAGLDYGEGAVSPDGRLLAVAMADGVRLWEPGSGREVAHLACGLADGVLFAPNGDLFAAGPGGVYRWPVAAPPDAARPWTLGPPALLCDLPAGRLAQSRDGATLVAVVRRPPPSLDRPEWVGPGVAGVARLDPHAFTRRPAVLPVPGAAFVALHPDGKHVAVGATPGDAVRVFDVTTGGPVATLAARGATAVAFDADGRWLAAVGAAGCQLWLADRWTEGQRFDCAAGSRVAFTPDARLVAVEAGAGAVRLLDPETGWEVARFEDPNGDRAAWVGFAPDGGHLYATTADSDCLHVWDVRALRQQLASRKLDYEMPDLPAPTAAVPPTGLTVVGAEYARPTWRAGFDAAAGTLAVAAAPAVAAGWDRRGRAFAALGWPALAAADFDRAGRLVPPDPEGRYARALAYLAAGRWQDADRDLGAVADHPPLRLAALRARAKARHELGQYAAAVADLDAVVAAGPPDADALKMRGLSHFYRHAEAAAIADFERGLKVSPDHSKCLNNLAWVLLTGPAAVRDPGRALEYARRAVQLAPDRGTHLNTLGVAHLRLGQYAEARQHLERALDATKGKFDGFNLYFLTVCAYQLGEPARAREYWEQAESWRRAATLSAHDADQLKAIRAEAVEAGPGE